MRSRKLFAASFERWRKNLMMPVPLSWRMLLQIRDRTIPVVPDRLLVEQDVRELFRAENLRMDAGD